MSIVQDDFILSVLIYFIDLMRKNLNAQFQSSAGKSIYEERPFGRAVVVVVMYPFAHIYFINKTRTVSMLL